VIRETARPLGASDFQQGALHLADIFYLLRTGSLSFLEAFELASVSSTLRNTSEIPFGSNTALIGQSGSGNSASQIQTGFGNSAEIVQISPDEAFSRSAKADGGNNPAPAIFGFAFGTKILAANDQARDSSGNGKDPGQSNVAMQTQVGTNNFAGSVQTGWFNWIIQDQSGYDLASLIVQDGLNNVAETYQVGSGNVSVVLQASTDNRAVVRQGQ
jgi:hypothetical protein